MLWRDFRREVTHCELFESMKAVIAATLDFFKRCNATARPGALGHRLQCRMIYLIVLSHRLAGRPISRP